MTAPASKPSFWRSMRMVGWGLLGVRKNAEYQKDLQQVNPLHVVMAGIIAVVVIVLGLVGLVKWVVGSAAA